MTNPRGLHCHWRLVSLALKAGDGCPSGDYTDKHTIHNAAF